jgi:hypothetical protein
MSSSIRRAAIAALVLHAAGATAAEATPSIFSFSGYGTLGAAHSSEQHADYTATNFQPNGAGSTRGWSADVDSRLGGQVTAEIDSHWSAVVQVVVEQRWDNGYTPSLEWANVRYAFNPDFSVRIGRIALPTFLMSNTRKVGYTLPWVRTPNAVYNALAMTNNDGADLTYSFQVGELRNTVVAYAGRNNSTYPNGSAGGYREHARHMRGVADTLTLGAATLQLSHFDAKLSSSAIGLVDQPYRVNSAGASYDPGNWFVMGEWARISGQDPHTIPSWYLGAGLRVGAWTPYAGINWRKQAYPELHALDLPQSTIGIGQRGRNAGLRWDFSKNADLKLQYDRNTPDAGSVGTLVNYQPGFRPGTAYNVVSLALDFVY